MDEKKLIVSMLRLNTKKLNLNRWNAFKNGIRKLYINRKKKSFLKRHFSQLFQCLEKSRVDGDIDLTLFAEYQKEIIHISENQIVPYASGSGIPVVPSIRYQKKINQDSGTIWTGTLTRKLSECVSFITEHTEEDEKTGAETWYGIGIDDLLRFPVDGAKPKKSNRVTEAVNSAAPPPTAGVNEHKTNNSEEEIPKNDSVGNGEQSKNDQPTNPGPKSANMTAAEEKPPSNSGSTAPKRNPISREDLNVELKEAEEQEIIAQNKNVEDPDKQEEENESNFFVN